MENKFEIVGVVDSSEIPEGHGRTKGLFEPVLERLDGITAGAYLHVKVSKKHHINSIQNLLKKKRSKDKHEVIGRGFTGEPPYDVYIKRMK